MTNISRERLIRVLHPEGRDIDSVDWSPDGKHLVIADDEGLEVLTNDGVQVWRKIIEDDPDEGDVDDPYVSWSPDGQWIASAGINTSVWNAMSGQLQLYVGPCSGRGSAFNPICWHPNSRLLAYWNNREIPRICIVDIVSREITLEFPVSDVDSISWSPDGSQLAIALCRTIQLHDSQTGACQKVLELWNKYYDYGDTYWVGNVCWSPDGRTLASGSGAEGTIRIWDSETGQCLYRLDAGGAVYKLNWAPDGRVLASCANDVQVRIWATDSGTELLKLDPQAKVTSPVAFSPDGSRLATISSSNKSEYLYNNKVFLWDVSDLVQTRFIANEGHRTLMKYIVRQAATIGRKVEQITRPLWVPHLPGAKGYCLGVIQENCRDNKSYLSNIGRGVAILPDGCTMVTGNYEGQVHCYDLQTGKILWHYTNEDYSEKYPNTINHISCSPNGKLLATGSIDEIVRILDVNNGKCIKRFITNSGDSWGINEVSWAPDSNRLASVSNYTGSIEVWSLSDDQPLLTLTYVDGNSVDWSPDGQFIVAESSKRNDSQNKFNKGLIIWSAITGEEIAFYKLNAPDHNYRISNIKWSPNGKYLALAIYHYTDNDELEDFFDGGGIYLWNVTTKSYNLKYDRYTNIVSHVTWSPDGKLIALSNDKSIRIWNTQTGKEIERFSCSEKTALCVAWSPNGAFLASSHLGESFRLWDTRHLSPSQTFTTFNSHPTQLFPNFPSLLPTALAQMHRLGIYPPLSLVQELLDLTGGHPINNSLAQLAQDPTTGIPDLIALRWSAPARIGLVALLLHKIPFPDWEPPSNTSPREISAALQTALNAQPIEPEAPPPPISLLREAGKLIDEKLLSLLTILGAKAVETEPALPLRLLSRVPDLPALSSLQRQLLGIRVCFGNRSGRSIGNAPGAERGQVSGVEASSKTDWISLLPSQLALPQPVVEYRHHRGELLFRTRELAEPPRLRPTVLLLDVTPPAFGPVEATTRIAAFAVANSLRQANIPVVLITNGEQQDRMLQLDNTENLVEIWTERTLAPANEVRTLKLANAVRTNLKDESGQEPMILLLTQPWFGAEKNIPRIQGLRGLFIQYPNIDVKPSIAHLCEKWETLAAGQTAELGQVLGYLMG